MLGDDNEDDVDDEQLTHLGKALDDMRDFKDVSKEELCNTVGPWAMQRGQAGFGLAPDD